MMDSPKGNISIKQAVYLALTVLCIYYPIVITANIPLRHWKDIRFLLVPAFLHFIFYVMLIVAIDYIINRFEKLMGPRILELRLGTIALSVVVAVMAVLLSQLLFRLNVKGWAMVYNAIERNGVLPGRRLPALWTVLGRANYALTFVISLSIFYLILNRKSYHRMRLMEVQAEQLRKESALAQFEALKNQVSPHFLFNSLSILSSLVHVDADLSEKFIDKLSQAYRYILEHKDEETVPLKTELNFLSAYAFLLQIRFENKFTVDVSLPDGIIDRYRIAPLTLQLLIENAVKHNRMSQTEPLVVALYMEGDYLVVKNPVRPRIESEGLASTGIGLTNIMNRYALLSIMPLQITAGAEWFIVKIPLL